MTLWSANADQCPPYNATAFQCPAHNATAYQFPPYNATAYQCPPYNATASMPHSVTKWMKFKYWAALFITFPPILMFKCQPWSKMCALAASLIILVTSCTYLEIWFDSGLHVPNDPCLTDSPWLLSCSSFSKRQESSNSLVSHESRLSTPVMHWDCKPAPVVSSSLSRNWLPLQAAAILSSL